MLSILFIYFVWKSFADLALEHDKSRWGFGILGVVVYYAGLFLFALVLGILSAAEVIPSIEDMNNLLLTLICAPFGILCCWGLYRILKSNWEKNTNASQDPQILDQDLNMNT